MQQTFEERVAFWLLGARRSKHWQALAQAYNCCFRLVSVPFNFHWLTLVWSSLSAHGRGYLPQFFRVSHTDHASSKLFTQSLIRDSFLLVLITSPSVSLFSD